MRGNLLPRNDPLLLDEDEIIGGGAHEAVERVIDAVTHGVDQLLASVRHSG